MRSKLLGFSLLCAGASVLMASCSNNNKPKGVSEKTGWSYNDSQLGGFEVTNYQGQQTGPGLVPIPGGRFTMGQTEDDIAFERNNSPRTVTVSSFYMDETEVANVHYREYIYWLQRTYGADYPERIARALPDTTVWREALSYNEPNVNYYFRHASYNFYPVVGVNWNQANEYCAWRSDRVNEMLLIKSGKLKKNVNQVNEDNYNTETYVADQYLGTEGKSRKKDLDPNGSGKRNDSYSDGILLPNYRLPTEAEWEYAALGLIDKNPSPATSRRRGEEALTDRKNYPWGDVRSTRSQERNGTQGQFMANYRRANGDYMGVTGGLNDNYDATAPVYEYAPNAYGLYNMAGNVNEWVLDVYRSTSHQDVASHRPFRGNVYTKVQTEDDYTISEKDEFGRLIKKSIDSTDISPRYHTNYASNDLRNYADGDTVGLSAYYYDFGRTTLVNDDSRVIKGGSWKDGAYWLNPGTRRYLNANQASATVGFRCVMDRLGNPNFNTKNSADFGKTKRK